MIRASDLHRRPVVDMQAGTKLGQVDDVVVNPSAVELAGFVIGRGTGLGGGSHQLLPASAVHAIGPDAITVRDASVLGGAGGDLANLPRLSHIKGRKLVSESGKSLGAIRDVLLEDEGTRLVGYELEPAGGLEALVGGHREPASYVRAGAQLRVGADVIVVPDDAVVQAGTIHPGREGDRVAEREAEDQRTGRTDGVRGERTVTERRNETR